MRCLLIILALVLAPSVVTAADFNAGMTAYDRQDYVTAAREFGALAEAGDYHAQYMLGRLYARGSGVAQDFVQAHLWYNLAASRGHSHAAQARDALERTMRARHLSEARRLFSQWKPGANVAKGSTPPATVQEVRAAIQKNLNELGYDTGRSDGVMGGKTRAAIRDYQSDHDIAVDGQPSETLLQHVTETLRTTGRETNAPASAPALAGSPWRRLVLQDQFQDGDYTRNPTWTVTAGHYSVERGLGLHSVHEPRQAPAKVRSGELPMAILSAILAQATRPAGSATTAEPPDFAEIHVDGTITNAFAMELKLTLRQVATGPLAFGPYQAGNRVSGYRLVYTPNVARGLHLVRLTASGSSVIESVDHEFSLNRQYIVRWTRDQRGEMVVSVDAKEIFRVVDRSLADPFTGFTLVNNGGDYALQEISIFGVD